MATDERKTFLRTLVVAPAAILTLCLLPVLGGLGACSSGSLLESQNVGPNQRYPVGGTSYYLPKRIVRVEVWRFVVAEEYEAEDGTKQTKNVRKHFAMFDDQADLKTIPDHRHQFVIKPRWDVASDDYVEVQMDTEGLLAGVYGHASDARGDIARGLTALFSMLVAGGSTSKWERSPRPERTRALVDEAGQPPRFIAEYEFDPVDPKDRQRAQRALSTFDITFSLTRQPDCPVAGSGAGCETTCDCTEPGIYYRLPIPYRFNLKPAGRFRTSNGADAGEWEFLEGGMERTILLPNEAICLYVPVNRASFVDSYTSLAFERGMLTEVKTDKPSELVGFFKIPVDVASAILAIPAELLTVRINRVNQQKDAATAIQANANAQKAAIESQIALLEAARKANGGGDAGGAGDAGGGTDHDSSSN